MGPIREWKPVRWARTHPFAVDAIGAGAIAALALVAHLLQDAAHAAATKEVAYREPTWWTIAVVLAVCAPVAWRRSRPTAAFLVSLVLQIGADALLINGPLWIPVGIVTYSLGAAPTVRNRFKIIALSGALVVGLFTWAVIDGEPDVTAGEAISLFAILAVCFLGGDVMRRRRAELGSLAARVERAERERELLAGQRVIEERSRIARDLHDVVAHSVSVMVIQASAARRNLDRNPLAAADLLENIEVTGRQTMGELRQVLGVLREPNGQVAPTSPVLSEVESLVRSLPELDVDLRKVGTFDDVPIGVALSAYRVVQEALTNASRHAGPAAHVEVHVECSSDRVDVTVSDNGRGASTNRTGGGYGLIGMRERVAAFGGTLQAGPRRSGGWQVSARFPIEPAADTATLPAPVTTPGP